MQRTEERRRESWESRAIIKGKYAQAAASLGTASVYRPSQMNELMQSQAVRVRSTSVNVNIPLSKNTKGLFFCIYEPCLG